jgi:mRNA-degrading endonuclease RelE of RelBE toxin-antitoxin system
MAHKWHLGVTEEAREQLQSLSHQDRALVFRKLRDLLNAENPTSLDEVTDIKELKEPKYAGLWRKRAGDWRILYRIDETSVTVMKVRYKGKLIFTSLLNRRDL